ncbi:MAG TPA: calcium-binding protein [Thermoleophilaceae bacterium]|nr:calcium-binding protein [Thermoleophilaceae bacterium]
MRLARGIWLVVLVLAVLASAPAAQAGTLSKANGEYVYTDADSHNGVLLYYCPGTECTPSDPGPYYLIRDVGDTISFIGSGCEVWATDTNFLRCPAASVTAWRMSLGAGNDSVQPQELSTPPMPVPLSLEGGAGTDSLQGGAQADSLAGGSGDDYLIGFGGDDLVDGGLDSDNLNGGAGTDTATYAGRSIGVRVDLAASGADDGSSEDGAAGARDTTNDVENVTGGSGADELRGSDVANRVDGGAGDDTLNAFAGQDTVLGGSGIDNVQARDGEAESVDCGPDEDAATTDAIDTRVSCDPPAPSAPPGVGGTTVITNTLTLPSRVTLDLAYAFNAGRRSTTLRDLFVEVEPGGRLTATCRTATGRACPRVRRFARATAARSVRLRGFERKPLPVGARVELRMAKGGLIGVVKRLTIRRRKAPSVRTLCLPPGASRPAAC